MAIPLFNILEAVVPGHTVRPYLPRHGIACILVPVELCAFTICHISL